MLRDLLVAMALACLLVVGPARAAEPIPTLMLGPDGVDLVATAMILAQDPASAEDESVPSEVRRAWQAANPAPLRPMYSSRWLVARLVNPADSDTAQWMLRMDTDPLYLPELVVMDGDEVLSHRHRDSAVTVGVESGPAIAAGQRFPLVIPPGETRVVALRVSAISYGSLAADVIPTETWVTWAAGHQAVVMAALGLLAAVGAYNLLLGIGLRSTTYAWYALHACSHLVYWGTLYGLTADLIGFTDHDRIVYKLSSSVTFWAAPLFVRGLLEPGRFAPWLDRALVWCGWIGLALILPTLLLAPWPEWHRAWVRGPELQFLLALVETPLFLLAGWLAWRHRVAGAGWFLVGWSTYLAAILSLVMATYGVWQFSGDWLLVGLLAATWEAVMLSQALAGRIKALNHARMASEARLSAQEDLLASVSHELRTPLNAILGMARLLVRDDLPARVLGRVQTIQRAGESLLGLVANLLDRASLDSGQLHLVMAPARPVPLVADAATLIRDMAAAKGLTLATEAAGDLPEWVQVDEARIRQVLINLMGNAVKYTDSGRVWVRVAREGNRLVFTVADSGPGIPLADRERIFTPFQRGAGTGTHGAGLGLPIARDLVRAMGGGLSVTDAPGGGACFRFDVPLVPAQPPVCAASRPLTVLLVDDIAINREIAAAILRADGQNPLPATPEEALGLLATEPVDAVLLDVNMPGMDGPELARRIRALPDPAKANLPILVLSAGVQPSALAELSRLGVKETLTKPLDPAALKRALARAFVAS